MKRTAGHAKIATNHAYGVASHAYGVASHAGRLASLFLLAGGLMFGAGCGTPPKAVRQDPEIERNVALARGALAAGSAEKSSTYYRQALNRARLMDDSAAIGRNAYNLAACLTLLRRYKEADVLLDEAESEFHNAGISAREVPLLKARLARYAGQTDQAMALVQSQLKAMKSRDPYWLQYQILLADLLCVRGDTAGAAREMARVNRKSLAAAAPAIQADAVWIRARLALLDNKPHVAGGLLDAAAGYFQQAGQYVDMALALEEAGRAYETAGDFDVAMDRYYRAARTLFLTGQVDRSARALTRAVLLADQSGQTEMRKKLKQLQTDINAARSN